MDIIVDTTHFHAYCFDFLSIMNDNVISGVKKQIWAMIG